MGSEHPLIAKPQEAAIAAWNAETSHDRSRQLTAAAYCLTTQRRFVLGCHAKADLQTVTYCRAGWALCVANINLCHAHGAQQRACDPKYTKSDPQLNGFTESEARDCCTAICTTGLTCRTPQNSITHSCALSVHVLRRCQSHTLRGEVAQSASC